MYSFIACFFPELLPHQDEKIGQNEDKTTSKNAGNESFKGDHHLDYQYQFMFLIVSSKFDFLMKATLQDSSLSVLMKAIGEG